MLLHINYHFNIYVYGPWEKRKTNVSILLHFNSRYFKGFFFLGLISDIKQKVLSVFHKVQSAANTLENLHDLKKMWFLPLEELTPQSEQQGNLLGKFFIPLS